MSRIKTYEYFKNLTIDNLITQLSIQINKSKIIFCQCLKISGINHRFIPIIIERVNKKISLRV